jgi:hypothetical protein
MRKTKPLAGPRPVYSNIRDPPSSAVRCAQVSWYELSCLDDQYTQQDDKLISDRLFADWQSSDSDSSGKRDELGIRDCFW